MDIKAKVYSVTLDEDVVERVQFLYSGKKLSPLINNLLKDWIRKHSKESNQKPKQKPAPKSDSDIDILGDDNLLGDDLDIGLGDEYE